MDIHYLPNPILVRHISSLPISSLITLKRYNLVFLLASFLFSSTSFAQQKTLGQTKHLAGSTEEGYVLFAPLLCKTTYLIDKCGKQVHSWKSNFNPGLSCYLLPDGSLLRTGIAQDTFFEQGGKGGVIEKINWSGNVIWSYMLSNDSLAQHHDIFPMENGNILIVAWHGLTESEALAKGRKKGSFDGPKLWSERILEIKPTGTNGAQIIWQWSLKDHLVQDESFSKPDFNIVSSHPELMNINYALNNDPDWIHINSIDYNKELNQVLLSCRNNSEIWVIDHSTTTQEAATHSGGMYGKGGDILYRWGNPMVYNKGTTVNQKFFQQHHAHWIPKGYKDGGDIMVFNNGFGRIPKYSSIDVVAPPMVTAGVYNQSLPFGPSTKKWIYTDSVPDRFYSPVFSGADRLANGNMLICSGLPGKIFEVNDKNTIVWEYINPVANGDNIMTDGETGGNSVFRATYYAKNYGAFTVRNLTPSGPIEKKSFSYSCNLITLDTTAPKVLVLFPANRTSDVAINTPITITFNEKIYKGNVGSIKFYKNNQWLETVAISDSKITINGKIATILSSNNFDYSSQISISIDLSCFKDSSNNLSKAVDSSNWVFNTIGEVSVKEIGLANLKPVYPNPSKNLFYLEYDNKPPIIQIVNCMGQLIKVAINPGSNRELIIDMAEFPDGIYSVIANGRFSQPLIKQ
ncbi:MAG: aryl-sulfate sulfotransferase [Bacteroidia bacterium]